MTLFFLDTSALVKRYLPEPGSPWVQSLISDNSIAVSLLAAVEVASALGRRTREGDLADWQRDAIFRQLLADFSSYAIIRPSQLVVAEAAQLCLTAPPPLSLRAADALQLASAKRCFRQTRRVREAMGSFVTADRALMRTAQWAGLQADNPEDHP